jgi:hypothetical protein
MFSTIQPKLESEAAIWALSVHTLFLPKCLQSRVYGNLPRRIRLKPKKLFEISYEAASWCSQPTQIYILNPDSETLSQDSET